MNTASGALSFVTDICGSLKELKRTGWVMRKVPFPESDSDHMHRCAMCALLVSQPADPLDDYTDDDSRYHPSQVDSVKLLKMAVTHDLCESLAGDITPFCGVDHNDKHAKEMAAMQRIRSIVGDPLGDELFNLWMEYEKQETVEAIYCKDIDKFEMVVQAYEYEKKYLQVKPKNVDPLQDLIEGEELPSVIDQPLRRFFKTTNSVFRTPLFRRLDNELRDRREAMLKEKGGWGVTQEERQTHAS
jgi:putative hydrolase of HD superfamily